jgi:hypothetical protein
MIYPLPMRFPVPINGGPQHIDITISPDGWSFITIGPPPTGWSTGAHSRRRSSWPRTHRRRENNDAR